MYKLGKSNFDYNKNVQWLQASAEKLPFEDNVFDFYTISFGIRNVTNINSSLKEAYRVLKPGGRFMCLEFSKIDNEIFNTFYKYYSRYIPILGKYVAGSAEPYKYLIRSIEEFYNQQEFVNLIKSSGFYNVEFRNLSGGISAIHSGWKI